MKNETKISLNTRVQPEQPTLPNGGVQTPSALSGLKAAPCLPFGRTPHEDISIFQGETSATLVFHTLLFVEASEQEFETNDVRHEEDNLFSYSYELENDYVIPSGISIKVLHGFPRYLRMPDSLANRLTAKQRMWIHDRAYLQIGFTLHSASSKIDVQPGLGIGMCLYDQNVSNSSSLIPENHVSPAPLSAKDLDLLNLVSWLFHKDLGVAVWNHSLVNLRNELLVKVGAEMRGLDPAGEYEKFLADGHAYFLDFAFSE